MKIIRSKIFSTYPELIFGFSTKVGLDRKSPYYFNMSHTVGDDKNIVEENRKAFYSELGLSEERVAFQYQIHSEIISTVNSGGTVGESDALITSEKNLGLAISSADCAAIFLYDRANKVIAGVHSGWRGSEKRILEKTIQKLIDEYGSDPQNIIAYLGPSVSQFNYQVGGEVAEKFDSKYILKTDNMLFLDVAGASYDMLLKAGVPKKNIEMSELCSVESYDLLHSYRREGARSGRAWGIIAMKEN
ncbi:MAG: peptidoglycan editing factor PgeF [Bacteroidetes bacterium]|nr:peptidoglycan editing factor PgeF [Bacteroidota bacterium]